MQKSSSLLGFLTVSLAVNFTPECHPKTSITSFAEATLSIRYTKHLFLNLYIPETEKKVPIKFIWSLFSLEGSDLQSSGKIFASTYSDAFFDLKDGSSRE